MQATAVDLLQAALQGVEPWHSALMSTPHNTPLPDFHDRDQLSAVLTVLALVRDHTRHVRTPNRQFIHAQLLYRACRHEMKQSLVVRL